MSGIAGVRLWQRLPADAQRWFPDDDTARLRYSEENRRIRRSEALAASATGFALVLCRMGPWLDSVLPGPWVARVSVIAAAYLVAMELVSLPFAAWRWRVEDDAGFSTESRRAALGKAGLRGLVVVGVVSLVAAVLWGLMRSTTLWWLIGGVSVLLILTLMALLHPLMLRQRLRLLADEGLRRRLILLAREAGVDVADAQVLDASRSTTKPNAFVTGFGRARNVVIFDTALDLPPAQIGFVLAHEVSHVRRHHTAVPIAFYGVALPLVLLAVDTATAWEWFTRSGAGIDALTEPGAVPLGLFLIGTALGALSWAFAWISRWMERRADLDALEFTRDADTAEALYRALAERTLGAIDLKGLDYLRASHPPIAERLELISRWRASRRAALLFTDVVDSTVTVGRVGDVRWFELLREHGDVVRQITAAHFGTVVKDTGDGFLVELPDVGAAVLAAIDIQRHMHELPPAPDRERLRVRMGVHVGEVLREGTDVRGREVHLAARVAGLAEADEILVSDAVRQELVGVDRFEFGAARQAELKGIDTPQRVHSVEWRLEDLGIDDRPRGRQQPPGSSTPRSPAGSSRDGSRSKVARGPEPRLRA